MHDLNPKIFARTLFDAAVAAAHPGHRLAAYLPQPPKSGRVILLAAGKAAASMIVAAEHFYLDQLCLPASRLEGLGVTRLGYGARTRIVPIVEAGHPIPDAAGLAATERALALARNAGAEDLVIVLLSGGGSANWIAPASGLCLADKQALTRALLRSGAPIAAINCLRKHLSQIKGGRLARLIFPAKLVTLAISDVPGDDFSAIASGPTTPDPTTLADARAIVARYAIALPPAASALLDDPQMETPKPDDPIFAGAARDIIAKPADSLAVAGRLAEQAGYAAVSLGADLEGEAREIAQAHAKLAMQALSAGKPTAFLSGGELTVTIRGNGRGGPNQEYILSLAIALQGASGIVALAGDTDGADGGQGASDDPAGAFCDGSTLERAKKLGLDPAVFLANNDSTGFFDGLGDLLSTGPTYTNVNDFRVILVDPPR